MIKVYVLSPSLSLKDGIAYHAFYQAIWLSKIKDLEVYLIGCIQNSDEKIITKNRDVHLHIIKIRNRDIFTYFRLLKKILKKAHNDKIIIHGHGTLSSILPYIKILSTTYHSWGNSKLITVNTLHGVAFHYNLQRIRNRSILMHGVINFRHYINRITYSIYELLTSAINGIVNYNMIDFHIATCNYALQLSRKYYFIPYNKLALIPHSVDHKIYRPRRKEKLKEYLSNFIPENIINADIIIGTVAPLFYRKGIIFLLKSFIKVLKSEKDVKLLIIGRGYLYPFLISLIKRLDLMHHIHIVAEYIPEHLFPFIYSLFDIYILPTLYEPGISTSLLQAMSSGLPVITTSVGGNTEVLMHEINGILIRPFNVKELAQYSWQTNSIKIYKIYKNLII